MPHKIVKICAFLSVTVISYWAYRKYMQIERKVGKTSFLVCKKEVYGLLDELKKAKDLDSCHAVQKEMFMVYEDVRRFCKKKQLDALFEKATGELLMKELELLGVEDGELSSPTDEQNLERLINPV